MLSGSGVTVSLGVGETVSDAVSVTVGVSFFVAVSDSFGVDVIVFVGEKVTVGSGRGAAQAAMIPAARKQNSPRLHPILSLIKASLPLSLIPNQAIDLYTMALV
jgi:hypothetical protein